MGRENPHRSLDCTLVNDCVGSLTGRTSLPCPGAHSIHSAADSLLLNATSETYVRSPSGTIQAVDQHGEQVIG